MMIPPPAQRCATHPCPAYAGRFFCGLPLCVQTAKAGVHQVAMMCNCICLAKDTAIENNSNKHGGLCFSSQLTLCRVIKYLLGQWG